MNNVWGVNRILQHTRHHPREHLQPSFYPEDPQVPAYKTKVDFKTFEIWIELDLSHCSPALYLTYSINVV